MIHITLNKERSVDPSDDALGRDRVGFSETMSPLALYDANHGTWKLGPRSHREQYALVSFQGTVRQAIEIDSIEAVTGVPPGDRQAGRSIINGKVLSEGHPVYDQYVDKPSPIQGVRNPVTYFEAPDEGRPCLCKCGATVQGRDFLPGHDQTALHTRVKQIGSVADFLRWFDIVRGTNPA